MEYRHIILVVLFCCSLLAQVESITSPHNVDTMEPFIITPPTGADPNDGFGWSSVFHQLQTPMSSDDFATALGRVRVLVGAPRGSAVGASVNRTGVVYSCPISTGGACEGIEGDTAFYISGGNNLANDPGSVFRKEQLFPPRYSEGRLYDQARNAEFELSRSGSMISESKSDQLMGSNLISTGNNVLACGSSWNYIVRGITPADPTTQSEFSVYRPWGICLLGNQQLQNFMTVSPCLRSDAFPNQQVCTGGISSVIANNRVYVGAPTIGPYDGQVRAIGLNNLNSSGGYSDASMSSASLYYGFETGSGFLTTQKSDSGTEDILATSLRYQSDESSPRVGAVFQHMDTGSLETITNPLVYGRQLAETFGYSVATVDLNGDGYDELVVGAPMYSVLINVLRVECGRIFIYYNDAGTLNVSNPHIIEGPVERMRFGLKVTNGGDLNSDGISDLIVSAPYEQSRSMSSSTGAIYVYHGFRDRAEFESQTPQRIHADDIVSAVSVSTLRTFGFSVSARIDTDNNGHADIVVGGYENQIVTVLRTRPFANVQVEFGEIPEVNLINDDSFNVRITANYSSADPSLTGEQMFGFRLTEQTSATTPARLFFNGTTNREYSGMLNFDSSQTASARIEVFFDENGDPTIPYQLTFSLVDVEKPTASLTRTGRVLDRLTTLPRFRLLGNPNITVNLSDLCNGDGCQSDVVVEPVQNTYTIVAGETSTAVFVVTYTNRGPEEARGLQLVISNIPTAIFEGNIAVATTVTGGQSQGLTCTSNSVDGKRNATCDVVDRFNKNEVRSLTIRIPLSLNEITSELGFTINVHILTDMTGNNSDANPSDNMADVNFNLESRSDIGVSVSFPQPRLTYRAVAPNEVSTSVDLGVSETLTVRVTNAGPSTILNARVNIYFPARNLITGSNFFLYPSSLISALGMVSTEARTNVTCSQMNIDPENLNTMNRKKRSSEPVRGRREVSRGARLPRQATTTNLNCNASPMACTMFVCNISRLTTEFVDVLLDYTVDERFFSSQETNMEYSLTAVAEVEVLDEFQRQGDNSTNDRSSDTVILTPPVAEVGQGPLFYVAIILPIVIGLILIIIVAFLLYYFGFFRRKKPEDGEELEPVPADNGPPGQAPAAPPKTENEDAKEEITKV